MAGRLRRGGSIGVSFFAFQDIITAAAGIMILVTLIMALNMGEGPTDPAINQVQQDPKLQAELAKLQNQIALAGGTNDQLRNQWVEMQKRPDPKDIQRLIERLTNEIARARQQVNQDKEKARAAADAIKEEDKRLGLDGLRAQLIRDQNQLLELSNKVASAEQRTTALEQQKRQIQSQLLVVKSREGQLWLVPDLNATTKEPILVVVSGKELTIERFDRPNERVKLDSNPISEFKTRLKQYNKNNQYFVFYIRPSGISHFDNSNDAAKAASFDTGFEPLGETEVIHFSKPKESEDEVPIVPASPKTSSASPPPVSRPTDNTVPSVTPPPVAKPKPTPPPAPPRLSLWQKIKRWLGFS